MIININKYQIDSNINLKIVSPNLSCQIYIRALDIFRKTSSRFYCKFKNSFAKPIDFFLNSQIYIRNFILSNRFR